MKHIAQAIAAHGRGPDTELVHMTKGEVAALAKIGGLRSLPVNPKTSLPEAGLLSTILPMAAMFIPGLQGVGAYMLAGAAGGALGSAIEGGPIGRGALMGGLSGALGGMASGWGAGADAATLAPEAAAANTADTAAMSAITPPPAVATAPLAAAPGATPSAADVMTTDFLAQPGAMAPVTAAPSASAPAAYGSELDLAQKVNTAYYRQGASVSDIASATRRPMSWVTETLGLPSATPAGVNVAAATPTAVAAAPAAQPSGLMANLASTNAPAWVSPTPVDYATAYTSAQSQLPTATPAIWDKMATRAVSASNPSFTQQLMANAAANPKTALGIGALGAYGLKQAMKPTPNSPLMRAVNMAGPSTSGITQVANPVAPAGGGEATYFTGNQLSNYTQAPGYTVMRPYAAGGRVGLESLPRDERYARMKEYGERVAAYARGGSLNLRGHRGSLDPMFTRGAGDGMSDSIPAYIDGGSVSEPIRVADGEYIVPADAVSHLGNGSSNAGAKKLDKMVSTVRKARTGKSKQAPQVKTGRLMPA